MKVFNSMIPIPKKGHLLDALGVVSCLNTFLGTEIGTNVSAFLGCRISPMDAENRFPCFGF